MLTKLIASIFVLNCFFVKSISGFAVKDDASVQLLRRTNEIKSFMNETADPCEDFFEFTCGKWSTLYPAHTGDKNQTRNYVKWINSFDKKVIGMLKNEVDSKDLDYDKKVKTFFQSCIKQKNGVDPERMIKLLEEFGKMPALVKDGEKWHEKDFDWIDTLARIIEKYGFGIIIHVFVSYDSNDDSVNRLVIGSPYFKLKSKSVYLEPMGAEYRTEYKNEIASNLNEQLKISYSEAKAVATRIVDFEIKLAKGLLDNKADTKLDEEFIKTNAEKLQQKYCPTIDVKRLLKIVLGEIPEGIIYEYPSYLQNVKEVIEQAEKRDVANYLFYHVMRRFKIEKSKTKDNLEKSCLAIAKEKFHRAIDNMFYRHFLDKHIEAEIQEFWHIIKKSFKTKLLKTESIDWLTAETRAKALEKLEALQLTVKTYDNYNFTQDFGNLTLSEDDFVGNLQNKTVFDNKKSFKKLYKKAAIETSAESAKTPVYGVFENRIHVPVSSLQPYFVWAPNFPDTLKFSLLGFFLAHELIHAFDDNGRKFGKSGRAEEWWDSESLKQFLDRRACFIEQYHSYVFGKKPLPKREIQAENIADNGGLKLAYDAFIAHSADQNNNATLTLPGLKYTTKQMFFIAYSQIWCSDIQENLIDFVTATDEHTPDKFRIIGPISNSVDFAEAFNCPAGSKMNPELKCKIY